MQTIKMSSDSDNSDTYLTPSLIYDSDNEESSNTNYSDSATDMVSGRQVVNTKKIGSVTLSLVKGTIKDEQVDVIVNSTSRRLKLTDGTASKDLLSAGGPSLQQECNRKYPNGIHPGDVAIIAGGGRLRCKHVYNVTMRKASENHAKKKLKETVTKCLTDADSAGLTSIALPALGTGYSGFDGGDVAKLMVRCICSFLHIKPSTSLTDIRILIFPGKQDVLMAFTSELKKEIVDRRERNILTANISGIPVTLTVGQLPKQRCEVLVTTATRGLKMDMGTLSKMLSEAAGPSLQQECGTKYPQGIQHGEIAVLGGGNIPGVKQMYCVAIPRYDKPTVGSDTPKQVLEMVMKRCLEQATKDKVSSIAFAALGSGYLMFPDNVSADVMFAAIKTAAASVPRPSFTVRIVIHSDSETLDGLVQAFRTYMNKYKTVPVQQKTDTASASTSTNPSAEHTEDKESKQRQMSRPRPKRNPAPSANRAIRDHPKPPAAPPRGTPEFCFHKFEQDVRPPSSWTAFTDKETVKKWKVKQGTNPLWKLVDVNVPTRTEVENLVRDTWLADKVGHGRDALGLDQLGFSKIRVTKVERIENLALYEEYANRQSEMFRRAGAGSKYEKLEDIGQTKGGAPLTNCHLGPLLKTQQYHEVNEMYLFHGTKAEHMESVIKTGIDTRLASGEAMLGHAVYMAESSTKADQYVDERRQRTPKGTTMKMLLIRVTMGHMQVTNNPRKLRKAPCMVSDCDKSDACGHENRYDSVVCDGKWLFREFVVYERQQAYPEFLIHYVRE